MHVNSLKLNSMDHEKRIYLIALFLSLLLHLVLFFVFKVELFNIDLTSEIDNLSEEVAVLFPENKPKQIVENINENDDMPSESDLLSDRNSRARNPFIYDEIDKQPYSDGNIPIQNLTNPSLSDALSQNLPNRKFSKDALMNRNHDVSSQSSYNVEGQEALRQQFEGQETTNNIYDQKRFSADQLGDLSLSTYAWEWAPYINALKRKLQRVWFTPPAYYQLGLIYGSTVIRFSISKEGNLIEYDVLQHKGHESLEQSSINAIKSTFPFKPLPSNFPDERLVITARLIYPNLRERIH